MSNKKSFALQFWKTEGPCDPSIIIIRGKSLEQIKQSINKIITNIEDYVWIITPFENITKVDCGHITKQEIECIENEEERLEKIVGLYENILIKEMKLSTLNDMFSPYMIPFDEKNDFTKTLTGVLRKLEPNTQTKYANLHFRWLPKKSNPFNLGESQLYELWVESYGNNGNLKNRIVFRALDKSHYVRDLYFVPFVKEFGKIIPDLKIRIESLIFQNL
jgi:hypothetical protein